jgi:hypothetical protein
MKMRYKIEILKVGIDKPVDIPEGCIPIKYDVAMERLSSCHGTWRLLPSFVRTLTILMPIEDREYIEDKEMGYKNIEEKCFFCGKNFTIDKVGIRPICQICLGELYGLARESHKSQEC